MEKIIEMLAGIGAALGFAFAIGWAAIKALGALFADKLKEHGNDLKDLNRWSGVVETEVAGLKKDVNACHDKIRELRSEMKERIL